MAIVTVKDKYQVVIPRDVREQAGVNVGDLLEARLEKGKITFTPKVIVDRAVPRPNGRDPLATLRSIQADAKRKGLDKLTMRDINAIIAEVRRERRQRVPASRTGK